MDDLKAHDEGNPTNRKHELRLVRNLCDELLQNKINYCHWKSNASLDRSASGENDLDLLISRADILSYSEILSHNGCKLGIKSSKYQLPGVLDYYGYDHQTGRLIHVHSHYQLILGHDATKNYHIPVEGAYLASTSQNGIFMVPSPEFELIILVIRLIIKHSTWDTLLLHQGKLSPSESNELDYLLNLTSEAKIFEVLRNHLPFINPQIFTSCSNVLTSNCSVWERARTGQKLLNCIAPFARRRQIYDTGLKFWRRIFWPLEKRIIRKDERKQMNSGGLMIAIVGGDGAGKTTVVDNVYKWLSRDFKIKRFHMGKPKWSYLTIFIRGLIKIGRSLGFYPYMEAEIQYTNDLTAQDFPGYPTIIRSLCTCRDRYITYKAARRYATNGGIVILDRFPMSQIKFMDGPHIARITGKLTQTRFLKYLIAKEVSYYQMMALPELLIVLRTDPNIAVQRKTDEDEESVRARSTEIWELDWKQTPAYVIDANRSKEEVLSEVKGVIWSRL